MLWVRSFGLGSARAPACSGWRLADRTQEDAIGEGADGYTRGRVCSPEMKVGAPPVASTMMGQQQNNTRRRQSGQNG